MYSTDYIVDRFKATKKAVEEGKAIFRETGKALQDQLDFIQKKDILSGLRELQKLNDEGILSDVEHLEQVEHLIRKTKNTLLLLM